MIDSIVHQLLDISDEESGGDNALDGFEFQVSSAIYLIFKELKYGKDFSLIYEKIEDFIIVTDKIKLYQAKSISTNLTPRVLYKPSKKTENESSGLSIIEKMYVNYNKVINVIPTCQVESYLLICENYKFSTKLSKNHKEIQEITSLNFKDLSSEAKQEIVNATTFDNYDWTKINATRLIPKPRHEAVTRIFIEDTISGILGDNKINSTALYNALTYEIRKIRKNKSKLTKSYLSEQIQRYTSLEGDIEFNEYAHLLNEKDKRSIQIHLSFNKIKNSILIKNHPSSGDYVKIKENFPLESLNDVYEIFDNIKNNNVFEDICIRLNDYEIKALILLLVAKELS